MCKRLNFERTRSMGEAVEIITNPNDNNTSKSPESASKADPLGTTRSRVDASMNGVVHRMENCNTIAIGTSNADSSGSNAVETAIKLYRLRVLKGRPK